MTHIVVSSDALEKHLLLTPPYSARQTVTPAQKKCLMLFGAVMLLLVFGTIAAFSGYAPSWVNISVVLTMQVAFALVTTVYMLAWTFRAFIVPESLNAGEIQISTEDLVRADIAQLSSLQAFLKDPDLSRHLDIGRTWPTYMILCPMYKEKASTVRQFIENMLALDYPVDRLQIYLLLEADDTVTLPAVNSMVLPDHITPVLIPPAEPRTKPKACNVGLAMTEQEYVVIYDAEDRPEPNQLKKAVLAFEQCDDTVVAIQAKLAFENPYHPNLLRSFLTWNFSAEYAFYFGLILPGLGKSNLPVPLGGTSNHFRTNALKQMGGWDGYNVTEDLDLGMRIARNGKHVRVLDSITWEEVNSRYGNYIKQRSRWMKGHFQTYLVHMRNPWQLYRDLGFRNFMAFQLLIGAGPAMLLFNPFYWVLTAVYAILSIQSYTSGVNFIEALYPAPVYYMGVVSMLFGNLLLAAYVATGCMLREQYRQICFIPLIPIYWAMGCIATWKGFIQLLHNPFYWEKTEHGLDKEDFSGISSTLAFGSSGGHPHNAADLATQPEEI